MGIGNKKSFGSMLTCSMVIFERHVQIRTIEKPSIALVGIVPSRRYLMIGLRDKIDWNGEVRSRLP